MNYGILLLLWIVLPDFTSAVPHTPLAGNLQWQLALAIPACMYYCRMFHVGIFKKLYEERALLAISIVWIIVFTFLKGAEISFKDSTGYYTSSMIRFNDIFDMIFVMSYPAFILINAARISITDAIIQPITLKPAVQKNNHTIIPAASASRKAFKELTMNNIEAESIL